MKLSQNDGSLTIRVFKEREQGDLQTGLFIDFLEQTKVRSAQRTRSLKDVLVTLRHGFPSNLNSYLLTFSSQQPDFQGFLWTFSPFSLNFIQVLVLKSTE